MKLRYYVLGLVLLMQGCGATRTIQGPVSNPMAEASLQILVEKETMKYGLTSVPYGAEVKKKYTKDATRTINVCGARISSSKSKSSTTTTTKSKPKPTKNKAPKNPTKIDLKKKEAPKPVSKPIKPSLAKPKVSTPTTSPCKSKTEHYKQTFYDVKFERMEPYRWITNNKNSWGTVPSYPNMPYEYQRDDDYEMGSRNTKCTVNIKDLQNITIPCDIYKQLNQGSIIKGEYSPLSGLQNITIISK
jgi:hypothetical protein